MLALFGLMLCGIGVGAFLYSGLGLDPASVFMQGLGKSFDISYGTASALVNITILGIVFLIDRKYIHVSSILAIFGIGYTADFTNLFLNYWIGQQMSLPLKILLLAVGLLIMGTGVATYIRADLGVGAIDLVSEIISDKTHKQYRWIRIFADATFFGVGFLLGGQVGVGTIVAVLLTGPTVQFVRPFVFRVTSKILINNKTD